MTVNGGRLTRPIIRPRASRAPQPRSGQQPPRPRASTLACARPSVRAFGGPRRVLYNSAETFDAHGGPLGNFRSENTTAQNYSDSRGAHARARGPRDGGA